jgi:hypothetical protein
MAASNLSPKTVQKHVAITCGHWAGNSFAISKRLFSAKEARGADPPPNDRVRWATPLSRGRTSAEIVRFHLPEVPAVTQQTASLRLAITHKFPQRGKNKSGEEKDKKQARKW